MSDIKYKTSQCCEDSREREVVVFYSGKWRYDCDDGMKGYEINYCPFCGKKLEQKIDIKECCAYWKHRSIRKIEDNILTSKPVNFCPECGENLQHSLLKCEFCGQPIDVHEPLCIVIRHPDKFKCNEKGKIISI